MCSIILKLSDLMRRTNYFPKKVKSILDVIILLINYKLSYELYF